jgi:signal transduction histidine kinase/AmiR/NasT family two-component response regulator
MRRRRLFHRVAFLTGTLVVLAVALTSMLRIRSQERLLVEKLQSGAAMTARVGALSASDALAAGDVDTLSRLVATIAYENDDVARALVTDRAGTILAHSDPTQEGTRLADLARPPPLVVSTNVGGVAPLLQVTAPILVSGEPWGALRIELPLAAMRAEMWHEAARVALTGFLVLLLGALGAARVAASVARPVERLAAVAEEIGRGNLTVRSGYQDSGELGTLARSFDRMIDELALASAQLRDYSTSLEQKVAERTAELERAMRAAEAAGEAKSEFLASMSHELRTPLHGIFGMTELALDTADHAEQRHFIGRARACAESLLTIVNDVLDFSKIEAGRLDLERVDFDVRDVTAGVLDTLAIEAGRKGLELIAFVDPTLPERLRGDPARLRQVLLNLATNAVKFTERGDVVIRVERAAATDAGGIRLRGIVQDTGIGIPAAKQQAIFEAFTQVDSSDARRYGGTGLGLAIARRLVTLMDGTIAVESEPGRGSTFRFEVGLEEAAPAATARVTESLDGMRVLVVDDNSTNRAILLKTLQAWGCRVALAGGGIEGCDLVAHAVRSGEPFDLVLLDMQMPDLNGLGTARRIRRDEKTAGVPIILLTSVSRALPDGAADVRFAAALPKPLKQTELRDAIVAATRATRRSDAAASA